MASIRAFRVSSVANFFFDFWRAIGTAKTVRPDLRACRIFLHSWFKSSSRQGRFANLFRESTHPRVFDLPKNPLVGVDTLRVSVMMNLRLRQMTSVIAPC